MTDPRPGPSPVLPSRITTLRHALATLLLLAAVTLPGGPVYSSSPLPAGHYSGRGTATWTVTSSPKWLGGAALKALALKEGIDELPASGSCTGVVGLDVPGDGGPIDGAARCEFAGDLARYNNRVAKLSATQTGDRLDGTARCCGVPQTVTWQAQRLPWQDAVSGSAAGSTAVEAVSVETRFGDVEVSLRVDWSIRFVATLAE